MWRTWRCFPVIQLHLLMFEWRYSLHVCLRGVKNSFFFQTLLFTAFLVTVLKILAYALVSTWSLVSSAWEHVKRKMHPCWSETWIHKISPCRCYATICKIRPLRPKSEFLSNILFVTLWHPEGHAGSSPVRIDVNHQKSSLGKIWKKWLISVD